MRALAHGVAHVAEHEEVAERGAGETHHVVGLAGDQSAGEMPDIARGARPGRIRRPDVLGEVGPQRDTALTREFGKTVGEIDVVGRERGFDFPLGHRRAEALVDHTVGQHDGIVLCEQEPAGVEPIGHQREPHAGQRERGDQRPEDALARHREVPSGMGARHCVPSLISGLIETGLRQNARRGPYPALTASLPAQAGNPVDTKARNGREEVVAVWISESSHAAHHRLPGVLDWPLARAMTQEE